MFVRHARDEKPSTLRAVPSASRLTVHSGEPGPLPEQSIRRLLDDARDMVYRIRLSPTRSTEYIGGAVQEITGHSAGEFYRDPGLTLKAVHPEDAHLLGIDQGAAIVTTPVTIRWLHADGRIVFAEHRLVPIVGASGKTLAVEGIARDITSRIETQQKLKSSQEQMRRLAASLQTAREEERASVARELHDELGQTLTALKLELGRTADALKEGHLTPPVMDRLQTLVGLVEIGVAMVKRIATNLRPPALDHLGLAEAIRWEATTFSARSGLRCHVVATRERTALTPKQQTALFRIFQEALTNVVRHAQASAVRVRLTETSRVFELRVADNGRGITDAEIGDSESIGLLGMRERASQAGAALELAGVPGRGTVNQGPGSAARQGGQAFDGAAPPNRDGTTHAMIRILLVDDHPVVRHGIRSILLDRFRDAVVAEAGDASSALREVSDAEWDIVLVDISMPGPSGLDLIKQLHTQRPALPLLVVSMHPPAQFARRALGAGALGYLTKDSAPEDFVTAIEQARRGRRYVGPVGAAGDEASELLATWPAETQASPHDSLSDREYQVLRMLGSGLTVSDIARALTLSVKTISTYRTRVLDKLGMRSNAELMRYAIENGLLDS